MTRHSHRLRGDLHRRPSTRRESRVDLVLFQRCLKARRINAHHKEGVRITVIFHPYQSKYLLRFISRTPTLWPSY